MRVVVISDTHGKLRPEVRDATEDCDAVIHAGDFDNMAIYETLERGNLLYAVEGNNDVYWDNTLRHINRFTIGGVNFLMTHDRRDVPLDKLEGIDVVIFGHSHKYFEQKIDGRLWLNPGACGKKRFNLPLTFAVLNIENGQVSVEKVDIKNSDTQ